MPVQFNATGPARRQFGDPAGAVSRRALAQSNFGVTGTVDPASFEAGTRTSKPTASMACWSPSAAAGGCGGARRLGGACDAQAALLCRPSHRPAVADDHGTAAADARPAVGRPRHHAHDHRPQRGRPAAGRRLRAQGRPLSPGPRNSSRCSPANSRPPSRSISRASSTALKAASAASAACRSRAPKSPGPARRRRTGGRRQICRTFSRCRPRPLKGTAETIAAVRAEARKHGRTIRFWHNANHIIARTDAEARAYAEAVADRLEAGWRHRADPRSLGQARAGIDQPAAHPRGGA